MESTGISNTKPRFSQHRVDYILLNAGRILSEITLGKKIYVPSAGLTRLQALSHTGMRGWDTK